MALTFAELYRAERAFVRRIVAQMRVGSGAVDDVTQDVFVVAHRRLHEFQRERGTVRAWLYGIAWRCAMAARRKERRALPCPSPTTFDGERVLARIQAQRALDALAKRMPSEQFGVFVLAEVEGLGGPEIAQALGVNLNTVHTRLRRARAQRDRWVKRTERQSWFAGVWAALWQPPSSVGASLAFANVRALAALIVIVLGGLLIAVLSREAPAEVSPTTEAVTATAEESVALSRGPAPERARAGGLALADPRAAITGTVRGAHHPLRGALVCARDLVSQDAKACATTDAAGRYAIGRLPSGRYRVYASADRLAPATARTDGRPRKINLRGQDEHGVDITLVGAAVRSAGHVTDATGGPIEGALVTAAALGTARRGGAIAHAHTDDEGTFSLWTAPGAVEWTAEHDGYADNARMFAAPVENLALVLHPASSLRGRVVDRSGRAVPRARVTVSRSDGAHYEAQGVTVADDAGRFELGGLGPGHYRPVARGQGVDHTGQIGWLSEDVALSLGEARDGLTIVTSAAASLEGEVRIGEGPQAPGCTSGRVELLDDATGMPASEAIDGTGAVRFAALPVGRYLVQIYCDDIDAATTGDAVTLVRAEPAHRRWHLAAARTVRGTVLSSAGEPVQGASILVEPGDALAKGNRPTSVTSDADGDFTLSVAADRAYAIAAHAPGVGRSEETTITPGDATGVLRLVIAPAGAVEVTVLDDTGAPQAGVALGLRRSDSNRPGEPGQTTRDGVARFEDLVAGDYVVTLAASYREDPPSAAVRVTAEHDAHATLSVGPPRRELHGIVVSAQGEPVRDASVIARPQRPGTRSTAAQTLRELRYHAAARGVLTDAEGRFSLPDTEDFPHVIAAVSPTMGQAHVLDATASDSVRLVLQPGRSLLTKLRSNAETDLPEAVVVTAYGVTHGGLHTATTMVDGRGSASLSGLLPDTYDVMATASSGSARVRVVVGERGTSTVELELVPRATATGRVVDLISGAPVADAGVVIAQRDAAEIDGLRASLRVMGFSDLPRTGADGRFSIPGVGAGDALRIIVVPPNAAPHFIPRSTAGTSLELGELPVVAGPYTPRPSLAVPTRRGAFCGTLDRPEAAPAVVVTGTSEAAPTVPNGATITELDGHDVAGDRCYLFDLLPLSGKGAATVKLAGDARLHAVSVGLEHEG
ncbi:MAG: sigma-70 family RNA polymerase sigma factor [Myxococcota bacterium]